MPDNRIIGQTRRFMVRSARALREEAQHRRERSRLRRSIASIILLVAGGGWAANLLCAKEQATQVKYAWVQMLPDEPELPRGRLARAIVGENDRCPDVLVDGVAVAMVGRPSPLRSWFPIQICEARLSGASDAWIGSRHLPTRPDDPKDIVVIGDTGCRMVHWQIQPCHNGAEWPFATVAASATAKIQTIGNKSVVIHVGDYHYRENPCADQSPKCGGSPYGDNWATWEEDFFKPASPLLLAAPWVIMRGNHEDCDRAGAGWIFFFALPGQTGSALPGQAGAEACQNDLAPYVLSLGRAGQQQRALVVLDTAYAKDTYGMENRCRRFRHWIDDINDSSSVIWLAVHQPLLSSLEKGQPATADGCRPKETKSAFEGIRARLLGSPAKRKVKLLLSGDTHLFQYFEPSDRSKPVQIIAGNGGTKLEELPESLLTGASEDKFRLWNSNENFFGVPGGTLTVFNKHGFVTMHSDGSTWTVMLLDVNGHELNTCRFREMGDATQPDAVTPPDCRSNPNRKAAAR